MEKYLIKNAKIWTADKSAPWAECIVINGKTIDYAGAYDEISVGEDVTEIDVGGRLVIPSFLDSHTHIVSVAKTLWCLLLEAREYSSIDEIMEIVKKYAEEHSKEEVPYIYAYSCPTELMDVAYADRYFMDRYISDRPVLLCDMNFHRCLVNSKMLELMEIDETVPYDDTTSCNYERFEDNTPNGIVEERAFEFRHDIDKMYEKIGWKPPSEAKGETLAPVAEIFTDYGISGVTDGFTESEDVFKGLNELQEQGKLNFYYHGMPLLQNYDDLEETIKTVIEWQEKYSNEYITVDTVKYFLDGTNELGTGAVIEPFVNEPDNYGMLNMSEDRLTEVFERLNQEGLNIQIHLVGDRAFRTALNAVERARTNEAENGRNFDIRVTLLHCELIHPDDRKRVAQLGVYINFTPIWAGGFFGDASEKYLGEERYKSMYSFNEIIQSGAIVNYSSDIVDEEGIPLANPFLGIQTGNTRADLDDPSKIREPVSECISRDDLMTGYTINNALGMGIADKTGSLAAGKMANLCILSDNIFECKPQDIGKITAETVIFEGRVVKGEL